MQRIALKFGKYKNFVFRNLKFRLDKFRIFGLRYLEFKVLGFWDLKGIKEFKGFKGVLKT